MSRPRRTWPQRLLIAVCRCSSCCASRPRPAWPTSQRQVSDVPRLAFGSVLDQQSAPGEPQNILLVGVDNGPGWQPATRCCAAASKSLNTDTIMVLRVDPKSDRAALLSFPRDLWVPIAGSTQKRKINSALALGGPGAADPDDPAELRHPDQPLRAGRLRRLPQSRVGGRRRAHLLPVAGARSAQRVPAGRDRLRHARARAGPGLRPIALLRDLRREDEAVRGRPAAATSGGSTASSGSSRPRSSGRSPRACATRSP